MQGNKRGQHISCNGVRRACSNWTAVEFVPKFRLCLSPAILRLPAFSLISIKNFSRAGYVSMCLSWNWTKICTRWLSEKLDGKCLARGHEVPASRPVRSILALNQITLFLAFIPQFFFQYLLGRKSVSSKVKFQQQISFSSLLARLDAISAWASSLGEHVLLV